MRKVPWPNRGVVSEQARATTFLLNFLISTTTIAWDGNNIFEITTCVPAADHGHRAPSVSLSIFSNVDAPERDVRPAIARVL